MAMPRMEPERLVPHSIPSPIWLIASKIKNKKYLSSIYIRLRAGVRWCGLMIGLEVYKAWKLGKKIIKIAIDGQ
jgi:hypothetical protein